MCDTDYMWNMLGSSFKNLSREPIQRPASISTAAATLKWLSWRVAQAAEPTAGEKGPSKHHLVLEF